MIECEKWGQWAFFVNDCRLFINCPARYSSSEAANTSKTVVVAAKRDAMGAEQQAQPAQSSAVAAAATLQLLLREDRLLQQHEVHESSHSEEAAFSYAAALLQQDDSFSNGASKRPAQNAQARATDAYAEVDRKLALVESLAERVSRTSPAAVAGPLMRLHGYTLQVEVESADEAALSTLTSATLSSTRERCHRLNRQGEVLEGVARRVETSLQRGLKRMETATSRLSRVLDLSATLKMILRLQFESSKLQGYDWDDLRDLTRAAASVAVLEDLLARPEFHTKPPIAVVEVMRPDAQRAAAAVRKAAAELLAQHQERTSGGGVVQLGATLQVYFYLGELPQAAWSAVTRALDAAKDVSFHLFSASIIQKLTEKATADAKAAVGVKHKPGETERVLKKKLRELRAEAASRWAAGIADAAMRVWNLHRVLCRKSDPTTRQLFVDVVSSSPIPKQFVKHHRQKEFSIFSIFWDRLCYNLGERLTEVLEHEQGKLASDVAGMYPSIRAAALDMLGSLYDTMQASGSGGFSLDDPNATSSSSSLGILGGSAGLDDSFLKWSTTSASLEKDDPSTSFPPLGASSADTWTRADTAASDEDGTSATEFSSSTTTSSLSSIFQSTEWKTLQGSGESGGLCPLQKAFVRASIVRLCAPLQYMFPPGVAVDEEGAPMTVLPTLPSKYDLQKLDVIIRQELSLADPREGGGELSMTSMIAETIVDMVKRFCEQATGAISGVGEDGCLDPDFGTATEAISHDLNVTSVMVRVYMMYLELSQAKSTAMAICCH